MRYNQIVCPHGITPKNNCEECERIYHKEWSKKNRTWINEYNSKYRTARYRTDPDYREKVLAAAKKQRLQYPNRYKEYSQDYDKKRDMQKVLARRVLQHSPHLYPLKDSCEFCGTPENLQHGHVDYDFPRLYLTVCGSCNIWMSKPFCNKPINFTIGAPK